MHHRSVGESPIEWVGINVKGEIRTTEVAIDAEQFPLLEYKVIASDSELTEEAIVAKIETELTCPFINLNVFQIKINVIDVNDMPPVFEAPEGPFEIPENSPDGTKITIVKATDEDISGNFINYVSDNEINKNLCFNNVISLSYFLVLKLA